ncbi:MAG: SIMPL domain-containing protein [Eubacteriales bacterium]|nr:SIMPL domain-containing protein [Eubacteriales bacterium]
MKTLSRFVLRAALVALLGFALTCIPVTKPVSAAAEFNPDLEEAKEAYLAVDASATKIVTPDYALVNIAVKSGAPTAKEAADQCAETVNAVMAALDEQGVAQEDYKTSALNVYPQTDYSANPPEVYSYAVYNQLQVKVREIDKLGQVLGAALDAGANEINDIQYLVDETGEVYRQALAEAYQNAKAKADLLAESQKVELQARPVKIEEVAVSPYEPIYRNYDMKEEAMPSESVGEVPLSPQQLAITARVQVVFALSQAGVAEQTSTELVVQGLSTVAVDPDYARIDLAVEEQADTASAAAKANSEQMSSIFRLLQEMGLEAKDYQTNGYQVYSTYNYDQNPPVINGYYLVRNDLRVTVRDLDQLSELITRALDAGANNLNYLEYDANNKDEHYAEALSNASDVVQAKAQVLAEAAGLQGEVKLQHMAENRLYQYGPLVNRAKSMYAGQGAAAMDQSNMMPVTSGAVEFSAQVEAVYSAK